MDALLYNMDQLFANMDTLLYNMDLHRATPIKDPKIGNHADMIWIIFNIGRYAAIFSIKFKIVTFDDMKEMNKKKLTLIKIKIIKNL